MKLLYTAPLRTVSSEVVGARERVIYVLAEAMARQGHDVSLIGTADSSIPGVTIVPIIETSLASMPPFENPFYAQTSFLSQMTEKIVATASAYDLIHNHTYPEFMVTSITKRITTPMITTIHSQATPELDAALSLYPTELIAISESQKARLPDSSIREVIYNGIDTDLFSFQADKEDYLLWVGRVGAAKDASGEYLDIKGIKTAIAIAKQSGLPLRMAGKVEDRKFFEQDIQPHVSDQMQWIGDPYSGTYVGREEVIQLMQRARAFLMPIQWEEPFGLVMIEAMSTGTPVIAYKRGAASEIIAEGKTGFLIDPQDGVEGFVQAIEKLEVIEAMACREHVLRHFSLHAMISAYERVYTSILSGTS